MTCFDFPVKVIMTVAYVGAHRMHTQWVKQSNLSISHSIRQMLTVTVVLILKSGSSSNPNDKYLWTQIIKCAAVSVMTLHMLTPVIF